MEININEIDIHSAIRNLKAPNSVDFLKKKIKKSELYMPFDYCINDCTLAKVSSIKDFGITFDSKLNFQEHIDKIYCEASKNIFFIIRN